MFHFKLSKPSDLKLIMFLRSSERERERERERENNFQFIFQKNIYELYPFLEEIRTEVRGEN